MSYSKLRRFLHIDSLNNQIKKFGDIEKSIEAIDSELNIMASEFTEKNSALKGVTSSNEYSLSIKNIAKSKFDAYLEEYRPKFIDISKRRSEVLRQKEALLEDKVISKALNDINIIKSAKSAYRKGKISLSICDNIIKAKTGTPVKYSDIIVFNEEGKILLTQRSSMDDNKPGEWCIPGGHVDEGEEHDVAAIRELREETNINVEEVILVGKFTDSNAEICYYKAYVDSEEQVIVLDDAETHHYEWIDPYKDLDKFELIFDQKKNIKKVLQIGEYGPEIVKIKKAVMSGRIKPVLAKSLIEKAKNLQNDKVSKVMSEFKDGSLKTSSGKTVTDKKQALAIALSEAGLTKADYKESEEKAKDDDDNPKNSKIRVAAVYGEYKHPKASDTSKNKKDLGFIKSETENDIKKAVDLDHLKEMIEEHKRLIVLLKKHSDKEDISKELSIQENELESYEKQLEEIKEKSEKVDNLLKSGAISKDLHNSLIEKARSGKYADTASNRKLKRVGQPYGTSHKEEEVDTSGKKTEDKKEESKTSEQLNEEAKNSTVGQLEAAIKESSDPEIRQAAHNELQRREKEEKPKSEEDKKFGEDYGKDQKDKNSDKKEDSREKEFKTKDDVVKEIKRLRGIDTDDLKEISSISKKISDLIDLAKDFGDISRKEEAGSHGLSQDETESLFNYTESGYRDINKAMRSGKLTSSQTDEVNRINSALEKLPKHKGKVYRGMSMPEDVDKIINDWKRGGVVSMSSFTSTSVDKNTASKFGDFKVEIDSKTGRSVSDISAHNEKEVLFKTESKFKIKSIKVKKIKTPHGEEIQEVSVKMSEI